MKSIVRCLSKNSWRDFSSLWEKEYIRPKGGEVPSSSLILRSRFVREEELVDLSIVHLREMGKSCGIDEGNLQSHQWGWRGWSFGGDWSWSYCLWWCQGVSLQQRVERDTAQYPVNQWIEAGEPVVSQHCGTAWIQWSYIKCYGVFISWRKMDWKVYSGADDGICSAVK